MDIMGAPLSRSKYSLIEVDEDADGDRHFDARHRRCLRIVLGPRLYADAEVDESTIRHQRRISSLAETTFDATGFTSIETHNVDGLAPWLRDLQELFRAVSKSAGGATSVHLNPISIVGLGAVIDSDLREHLSAILIEILRCGGSIRQLVVDPNTDQDDRDTGSEKRNQTKFHLSMIACPNYRVRQLGVVPIGLQPSIVIPAGYLGEDVVFGERRISGGDGVVVTFDVNSANVAISDRASDVRAAHQRATNWFTAAEPVASILVEQTANSPITDAEVNFEERVSRDYASGTWIGSSMPWVPSSFVDPGCFREMLAARTEGVAARDALLRDRLCQLQADRHAHLVERLSAVDADDGTFHAMLVVSRQAMTQLFRQAEIGPCRSWRVPRANVALRILSHLHDLVLGAKGQLIVRAIDDVRATGSSALAFRPFVVEVGRGRSQFGSVVARAAWDDDQTLPPRVRFQVTSPEAVSSFAATFFRYVETAGTSTGRGLLPLPSDSDKNVEMSIDAISDLRQWIEDL